VLLERDVDPQLGLLKSTMLQLDSTFSERTYGAGSFRDFAQKLEKAGILRVHQAKGGWLVAPAEGVNLSDVARVEGTPVEGDPIAPAATEPAPRQSHQPQSPRQASLPNGAAEPTGPVQVLGTPAEGVSEMFRIISSAEVRKWPLYLRTVKQILRAQTPPFDERAYGFPSLVDLLRASHKEGAFRVERDRQGVIRVFQSGSAGLAAAKAPAAAAVSMAEPVASPELEAVESATPVVEEAVAEAAAPKKKRAARRPRAAEKTTSPRPAKKRVK